MENEASSLARFTLYENRLIEQKKVSVARIKGVRIKWVESRENVRAFFPQGQGKLFVITRCPVKRVSVKRGSVVHCYFPAAVGYSLIRV